MYVHISVCSVDSVHNPAQVSFVPEALYFIK